MSKSPPEKGKTPGDAYKQPVVRIATGGFDLYPNFRLFDGPVETGGYGETARLEFEGENRNSVTETPGGGEKSPKR